MLVDKKYEIQVTSRNKQWYLNKGYTTAKVGEKIQVDAEDISHYCKSIQIEYICDYCQKVVSVTPFNYFHQKEGKDCCQECAPKKAADVYKNKTGYKCVFSSLEKREQIKHIMEEKYGTAFYFNSDDYKEKMQRYLQENNVDNPFQIKKNQEKMKQTNLKRYGVECVFLLNTVQEKIKETNLHKYGTEFPMQNLDVKDKSIRSKNKIFAQRKDIIPCSKNQRYLAELFKGELNVLFTYYFVDIYFPEEKIYCEYDGGGHQLAVIFRACTLKEFQQKEKIRYDYLKTCGLKCMRIISSNDILPSEDVLLQMKEYAVNLLNSTENNWVHFNLDTDEIITKSFTKKNIEQSIVTTSAGNLL